MGGGQYRHETSFRDLYILIIHAVAIKTSILDYIHSTLKLDGCYSWARTNIDLLSTMIDASTSEVENLADHNDVISVMKFAPEQMHVHPRTKYLIIPTDKNDRKRFNATTVALHALINGRFAELRTMWQAYLSETEKPQVERIDGVREVVLTQPEYHNRGRSGRRKPRRCPMCKGHPKMGSHNSSELMV
ncbi:hypothetical protein ACHAPU_000764 [Fusarium lateritium]